VGTLPDSGHESAQNPRCDRDEVLVSGAGRQREQAPPQTVAQGFRITIDQTCLGERLQCSRHLALLPTHEPRDLDDADAALPSHRIRTQGDQNRDGALQRARRLINHYPGG